VSTYGARPGTGRYRYEWITPLAISPRPPHAIYVGAQVLFRSLDSGRTWETASPDLTGANPKAKGCDGDVPAKRASECGFGTLFAISPSPAEDGLVWMGTDNGRVLLTRDDTKSWKDVTPSGLPDWTRVNQIDASAGDPRTAYVAADGHRRDDFRPLAFRTHDFGRHWTDIGRSLPAGAWVGVVRQDPKRPGLLYAGTSRGMWVSFDDGSSWQSLQLNLPTTGINDLRVQGDDLIAATQGRAIWILDQLAPLRGASAASTSVQLVPPGRTYRLRGNQNRDTPLPPEEPRGENPPDGAVLDYVLPAGSRSPVTIEIADAGGRMVRHFSSEEAPARQEAEEVYFTPLYLGAPKKPGSSPGHHRFVWNLRYDPPPTLEAEYSIAAVPGRETAVLPAGAFVVPGRYRVRLTAGGAVAEQELEVAMDPRVGTSQADLERLLAFQRQVAAALTRSTDLERERKQAVNLLTTARDEPKAASFSEEIRERLAEIEKLPASPEENSARANAALTSLATDLEGVDALPTMPQRHVLADYEKGMDTFEAKWRSFASGRYSRLRENLENLGIKPVEP
jgi:hypothetical protein